MQLAALPRPSSCLTALISTSIYLYDSAYRVSFARSGQTMIVVIDDSGLRSIYCVVTQRDDVVVLKYQISLSKSTGSDIQILNPLNENSASSSESSMNINVFDPTVPTPLKKLDQGAY